MATALPKSNPEHVLHFLIVGGGMAGLSCAISLQRVGHRVTVFEQSDGTYRSDALVRCPPHMSRLMYRWGITEDMISKATSEIDANIMRDGSSNETVQLLFFHKGLMGELGASYHVCQHGKLYAWLLDLAKAEGAEIRFNSQVTDVDPQRPSLHLASGETITGDIVVGADGWNSAVRKVVAGGPPASVSTGADGLNSALRTVVAGGPSVSVSTQGRVAYHMTVPGTLLREDPELAEMLTPKKQWIWMADSCSLTAYWDPEAEGFFMVLLNRDNPPDCDRRWDVSYPLDELNLNLEPFGPLLRKLIKLAGRATPVTYLDHSSLESWVHDGYKVFVVGDAGEPSPPHTHHGIAAPIGDGLVLGTLFSRLSSPAQIPVLLEAFDEMRRPRALDLVLDEASVTGYFMLPTGPATEGRNAGLRFAHTMTAESQGQAMNMDEVMCQIWDTFIRVSKYDAYESACDWWTKWGVTMNQNTGMSLEIPVETEVEVMAGT